MRLCIVDIKLNILSPQNSKMKDHYVLNVILLPLRHHFADIYFFCQQRCAKSISYVMFTTEAQESGVIMYEVFLF